MYQYLHSLSPPKQKLFFDILNQISIPNVIPTAIHATKIPRELSMAEKELSSEIDNLLLFRYAEMNHIIIKPAVIGTMNQL